MNSTIKILFLAAEAVPFVKVGGLADVAGSLPQALRSLPEQSTQGTKLDVRLVLPLYPQLSSILKSLRLSMEFPVSHNGGAIQARVFEMNLDGDIVYFIDGQPINSAVAIYSRDPAVDREKFIFFSLAALELAALSEWHPDIIHVNDWHTALAAYALNCRKSDPRYAHIRSMLTLHNLPYMGGETASVLEAYGLPASLDPDLPVWARTQPLPLGLSAANAVVPVSPNYAHEILTSDFGCGLENFLRLRSDTITGILNGLDITAWDPAADKQIASKFNIDSLPDRTANKAALQKTLSLPENERIPLLAMVGRIDPQKGIDIAFQALRLITALKWQFVILGSSDPELENAARLLQSDFPDRIRAVIGFDLHLSRMIYAGADMLLMPSRYEPCGLAQMVAMRYGCVPLVRATGGLKDTVHEGKTGFLFQSADPLEMEAALRRSLSVFADPHRWEHFQRNGMAEDFSWPRSASRYAILYRSLISKEGV